jgi:hypothetical protein
MLERGCIKTALYFNPAPNRQDHGQPATRFALLLRFPGGQFHRYQLAAGYDFVAFFSLPLQVALERAPRQTPVGRTKTRIGSGALRMFAKDSVKG